MQGLPCEELVRLKAIINGGLQYFGVDLIQMCVADVRI